MPSFDVRLLQRSSSSIPPPFVNWAGREFIAPTVMFYRCINNAPECMVSSLGQFSVLEDAIESRERYRHRERILPLKHGQCASRSWQHSRSTQENAILRGYENWWSCVRRVFLTMSNVNASGGSADGMLSGRPSCKSLFECAAKSMRTRYPARRASDLSVARMWEGDTPERISGQHLDCWMRRLERCVAVEPGRIPDCRPGKPRAALCSQVFYLQRAPTSSSSPPSSMAPPTIAIIAAGAMGSPIAKILATSGVTVLTNLDGRSETTRRRARDAGMVDVPWSDIALRASCILSIVPPAEAGNLATRYLESRSAVRTHATKVPQPIFVDCNAVGPTTVQEIASKFDGSDVRFADGCIIGFPPSHDSSPTFYFAANAPDVSALKELENLGQYGLKLATLTGDGAGVGDASALKMSYGVRLISVRCSSLSHCPADRAS